MKETELYTSEELAKLIEAYQVKYNISGCDETPYFPEPIYVHLTGTIIRPKSDVEP